MSNVTTQQLAEILLGVARAQNAIIDAMENSKAGFKATHFRPTLESVSRMTKLRVLSIQLFECVHRVAPAAILGRHHCLTVDFVKPIHQPGMGQSLRYMRLVRIAAQHAL